MNVLSKLTAKGRIAAVLALGFATLFSGCKEEDPPAVSVDRPIIRTSMDLQTQDLRVISNTDWVATIEWGGETPWITLSRESGRGTMDLTLAIEKCTTKLMDGRQATIRFTTRTTPTDVATVIVKQGHDLGLLELQPDQWEVGSAAGTAKFLIQSNTQWEIIQSSDWASIAAADLAGEGDKLITVNVDAYSTHGRDRVAEFVVQTTNLGPDNTSRVFTLTQRGQDDPTLILGQETIYFEPGAGSMSVPVITNTSATPTVSSMSQWCTAVYNATTKAIDVTVTANQTTDQRQTLITVIAQVDNATITKQITVIQAGMQDPKLIVTNPNVTIAANPVAPATTVDYTVGFYTEPDGLGSSVMLVNDKPNWITSAAIVNGNAVEIKAQPNSGKDMRQATFTLKLVNAGKTVTATITVTQNGVGDMNLSATPLSLNAVQAGETLSFTVMSDVPGVTIAVNSSKGWVTTGTPVDASSAGNTVLTVPATIAANPDADSRDAVLTVVGTMGNQKQVLTVAVNQAGTGSPQASLVRNSITVAKTAGSYKVGVNDAAGVAFTCTATAAWITGATFTAAADPSTGTIDFGVDANTVSAAPRTGIINIIATKGGKSQQLDLEVIQLGTGSAELIVGEQDILLPAGVAGTNLAYTISVEPLNGSTWSVKSANPAAMFASAPATTTNTLAFSITPNTTTTPRSATVMLLATNGDSSVPYYITITQEGLQAPEVTPIAYTVYVGKNATTTGAETVIPFLNWDASVALKVLTVNTAMFTPAPTFDTGTANLRISVTANTDTEQRTGELTVEATRGGASQEIKITVVQAGTGTPDLTIGTPAFMFGPAAQTGVNLLYANENGATVTVPSYPSWITPVPSTNPGAWAFNVAANETNVDRSGEIILKAVLGGKTVYYNVPVTQYGLESLGASLTVSSIEIDYAGGTTVSDIINVLNVPAGAAVDVYSTQSWMTLNGTTNTSIAALASPYEVKPSVTANPYSYERIGTIAFEITRGTESQVLIVSVMQHAVPAPDALTLTVVPGAMNFTAIETTARNLTIVNYDAALDYTATSSDSWLTVSAPSTAGVITVTPSANTGSARTATIYVTVKDAAGAIVKTEIPVTQAGATDVALILDHVSVDFNALNTTGALVNVVNPDAGLTYSVVAGGTGWFTASMTTNTSFTVAPNGANDGASRIGYVTVYAKDGTTTVATKIITVTQAAYNAPELVLTLGQAFIDFAADNDGTTPNTFKAYAEGATFEIATSSADWIVADIDDASGAVSVAPIGANDGAARYGSITITAILNGVATSKSIMVMQEGVDPVTIIPSSYVVTFPSSATATDERGVTLIGFKGSDHKFAYDVISNTESSEWFTVTPPSSPVTFNVEGPWLGGSSREATIQVTITKTDDTFVSTFPITIIQNGVQVPNISYSPKIHHVSVNGTSAGLPAKTVFVNHSDLTLSVTSGIDLAFFTSAPTFNGDVLEMIVSPNPNYKNRIHTIVVTATDGTTNIRSYPITIVQDGTGAVAHFVVAEFLVNPVIVENTGSATTVPYDAEMTLGTGVGLLSASSSVPWVTSVTVSGNTVGYEIDETQLPTTSAQASIIATLEYAPTGDIFFKELVLSYEAKIGAAWINSAADIPAVDPIPATVLTAMVEVDPASLLPASLATDDLTVSNVAVTYTGTASGWIDATDFTWDEVAGTFTLNNIADNDTGDARSAVVKVTFSATGYKDQVLEFVVNQAGLLTMQLAYPAAITLAYDQLSENIAPTVTMAAGLTPEVGTITVANVDPTGWLADANCSCATGTTTIDLTCTQNDLIPAAPRYATIKFTVDGVHGYLPKDCEIMVIQMPATTQDLLTIDPTNPLACFVGSTQPVTYIDNGPALHGGTATTVTYVNVPNTNIDVAGVTSSQATVTAKTLNATGADKVYKFVLRAENSGIVEFYEISIAQVSLTQAQLIASVTMSKSNHDTGFPTYNNYIKSVSHGSTRTDVSVSSGYSILGSQINAFIDIDSILPLTYGTISKSGDSGNNTLVGTPSMSGNRLDIEVQWHVDLPFVNDDYTGTAVVTVPIIVDQISANFVLTINVSK